MSQNVDGAGVVVKSELSREELLALLAERDAEADRQAAPLLMLQTAEDAMVDAGEIDPEKGEFLEAFGPNAQGVFEMRIGRREPCALDGSGSSNP